MKWINLFLIFVAIFNATKCFAQECVIYTVAVNFGSYDTLLPASNYTTGEISVLCTPGLPFMIKANPGTYSNGSFQPRMMYSASTGDTLNYNLYRDTNHNEIFGDGIGSTYTYSGVGSDKIQQFAVYGLLPGSQNVRPGIYIDQVTVTVEW